MQIANGNHGSIGVVHKATVLAKRKDQAHNMKGDGTQTGAWCKYGRGKVTER